MKNMQPTDTQIIDALIAKDEKMTHGKLCNVRCEQYVLIVKLGYRIQKNS
mgnify:CR=1 FL=1